MDDDVLIPFARRIYPGLYDNKDIKPIEPIFDKLSPRMQEMMLRFRAQQMIEESCDCPICQERRKGDGSI